MAFVGLETGAAQKLTLDALEPSGRAQFVDHAGQAIPW